MNAEVFFACYDASNSATDPTEVAMQKRARRGALSRGASAAPMPRHRSASIDLRSTTATAVPKHGGRPTSFHQLCLCAKSSSTARLCRDPATSLPTRRLLGHSTIVPHLCLQFHEQAQVLCLDQVLVGFGGPGVRCRSSLCTLHSIQHCSWPLRKCTE